MSILKSISPRFAVAVFMLLLPVSMAYAQASPTFQGDFEDGKINGIFGGWKSMQAKAFNRFANTPDFRRQGAKGGKFVVLGTDNGGAKNHPSGSCTVSPGDACATTSVGDNPGVARTEVVWSGTNDQDDGQERWYRWWTRWPETTEYPDVQPKVEGSSAWQIFTQFHHDGDYSPPIAFDVVKDRKLKVGGATTLVPYDGEWIVLDTLDYNTMDGPDYVTDQRPIAKLTRGVWHEFVVHIKWSFTGSGVNSGLVEVWYDSGNGQTPTLSYTGRTLRSGAHHVKQGLYRNNETVDRTIYHDGFSVWTSRPTSHFDVSTAAWTTEFSNNAGWNTAAYYWQTLRFPDVNGDGRADVCGRSVYGIRCALSNGHGFDPPTPWTYRYGRDQGWEDSPSRWQTVQYPDLNHDGKADVCGRSPAGIECELSDGTQFNPLPSPDGVTDGGLWSSAFSDANLWNTDDSRWQTIQFADVNGDDWVDVCGRWDDGIRCALSNGGQRFGPALNWTPGHYDNAHGWNSFPSRWKTIRFVKLNTDKKVDVCGRSSSGIECATSNGASFDFPSSGGPWTTEFSDSAGWNTNESVWQTIQFPDVNGDGRADVCGRSVYGVRCALSNGSGFDPPSDWTPNRYDDTQGWNSSPSHWQNVRFPDINGDGKADVCGRSAYGPECGISNGTNGFDFTASYPYWTTRFNNDDGGADAWLTDQTHWQTLAFPDLNNDGAADVCGRTDQGIACGVSE